MVLMSAVIPAPEEGSKRAIVRMTGGVKPMAFTLNRNFEQGKNTSVSRLARASELLLVRADIFLSPSYRPSVTKQSAYHIDFNTVTGKSCRLKGLPHFCYRGGTSSNHE